MSKQELFLEAKLFIYEVIIHDEGLSFFTIYQMAYRKLECHKLVREFLEEQGYDKKSIYRAKYRFINEL